MNSDVIVVGAGPAGSATATLLARRDASVLVLDRARFPRRKPCAECLSPEAARPLAALGALEDVEAAGGARIRGWTVRSPDGTMMHGSFLANHRWAAPEPYGIAIEREKLDAILLHRARCSGAAVREGVRVTGLLRSSAGRVEGVSILDERGAARELRAPLVVGADGLRSVVARRAGLARSSRWPRRIALVSHWSGVEGIGEHGEMLADDDGYIGIASVGGGLANVALVVPTARAREISGDPSGFVRNWIERRKYLAERFSAARAESDTLAVGPFASHSRRPYAAGVALAGDAADFFDPFTGEGVYAALRGAELLVESLAAESRPDEPLPRDPASVDRALRRYQRARRRAFGGKWIVERLVGTAASKPLFMNAAVRGMRHRPDLADLFVGVTGDFVPPSAVLHPAFAGRLLIAAFAGR